MKQRLKKIRRRTYEWWLPNNVSPLSASQAGPRCEVFMPGCITCACHLWRDVNNRWPTYNEVSAFANALEQRYGDKELPWHAVRE